MTDRTKLKVGKFESWEARIDYQLNFNYERTSMVKQEGRETIGRVAVLEMWQQRLLGRVSTLEKLTARLQLACYLLVALVLLTAAGAAAGLVWLR